jgi:hypothetical protein
MIAKAMDMSLRFVFVLTLFAFVVMAQGAFAAGGGPPEGCDGKVQKAQQSRAEVQTAYDVDVTEEHIEKPDSTMATTCFNDLAGIDASGSGIGGGVIFSGDFISQSPSGNPGGLRADIQDSLQNFYTAYMDAMGADSGLVDYTQTALTNTATCNETQDLWTEVKQGGVEEGVPNATLTELLNGTLPGGANTDYSTDWGVEGGTDNNFSNYKADIAAQPPTWTPTYVQTNSFCNQMITANIPGAACP